MYKIYFNEVEIWLMAELPAGKVGSDYINTNHKLIAYVSESQIEETLVEIEEGMKFKSYTFITSDVEKLRKDFEHICKVIIAAGGVVFNEKGDLLMIYRRGKWDLPKGKVDKGEAIKDAALREVAEEAGVSNLEIVYDLPETYHIYVEKEGEYILKKTYWYNMTAKANAKLKPQVEENITEAKWVDKSSINKMLENSYGNIIGLLNNSSC